MIASILKSPLVLIIGFNLLLRALFYFEIRDQLFFNGLILDSRVYFDWARQIAEGDLLGSGPFTFSPLYPYFLTPFIKVFGDNLVPVRIFQLVLGSISAGFLYDLAHRYFGSRPAWFAVLLYSLYPVFILYEWQLLGTSLAVFFMILGAWLFGRGHESRSGAVLALAALARPNILLVHAALILWMMISRKHVKPLLPFVLGMILVLAPVAVRNVIVTGEFSLISTHGGINFYVGNNPYTAGHFSPPQKFFNTPMGINEDISKSIAEKEAGRSLNSGEVSRFWFQKGLAFILENPGKYLQLEASKLYYFFHNYEAPININVDFSKQFSKTLKYLPVAISLITSLALVGLVLCCRDRKKLSVLYVILGSYIVSVLLFSIATRYRLPAVPFLILFAGFALSRIFQGGHWQTRLYAAVGVLSALVFFNKDIGMSRNFSAAYNNYGNIYGRSGKPEIAEEIFKKGLAMRPQDPIMLFNLALALQMQGKREQALKTFKKVKSLKPDFPNIDARIRMVKRAIGKRSLSSE